MKVNVAFLYRYVLYRRVISAALAAPPSGGCLTASSLSLSLEPFVVLPVFRVEVVCVGDPIGCRTGSSTTTADPHSHLAAQSVVGAECPK